jgi:hypothetical protein
MEFDITCPVDGTIQVSLEDIDTVVIRDTDRADITFVCPECGTEITVTAVVPSFLLAAIEALAEDNEGVAQFDGMTVRPEKVSGESGGGRADDGVADAYCEYFRRQLAHVECVEDAVAEMDMSR